MVALFAYSKIAKELTQLFRRRQRNFQLHLSASAAFVTHQTDDIITSRLLRILFGTLFHFLPPTNAVPDTRRHSDARNSDYVRYATLSK